MRQNRKDNQVYPLTFREEGRRESVAVFSTSAYDPLPMVQAMMKRPLLFSLLASFPFAWASCGSSPKPEKDPEIEQRFLAEQKKREEFLAKSKDTGRKLILLDQAMFEFSSNFSHKENPKAQRKAEGLLRFLRTQTLKIEDELIRQQREGSIRDRSISTAALGFVNDKRVLPLLVAGLKDKNPQVRISAAFALGVQGNPLTPVQELGRILLDGEADTTLQRNASWALMRIQENGAPQEIFRKLWEKYLKGDPISKDLVVLVHSIRGLGLLRSPDALPALVPYLSHPKPLIRQATAIAIGRAGNRDAAKLLIDLLGGRESNPNVRLAARKALKALAGGAVDREYDLAAWKKEFGL
ncbi:MAG TPA: HEAT repeat domain-containing protein [Planctomycetes bacterium]|nr:HEAT repeat domain-containing protein [Planctomycetota bacterium]